VTADELVEILRLHASWLRGGENGRRANLSEANLREANLSGANLSEANLREANLREANLSEANLREADLSEANLIGADLSGANLRGADLSEANLIGADLSGAKGFALLPVGDPRGYSFAYATLYGDEWRIRSGCRDFSITAALEHWGHSYQGERWIGDMYLAAIDWFETRLASGEVPV